MIFVFFISATNLRSCCFQTSYEYTYMRFFFCMLVNVNTGCLCDQPQSSILHFIGFDMHRMIRKSSIQVLNSIIYERWTEIRSELISENRFFIIIRLMLLLALFHENIIFAIELNNNNYKKNIAVLPEQADIEIIEMAWQACAWNFVGSNDGALLFGWAIYNWKHSQPEAEQISIGVKEKTAPKCICLDWES